MQQKRDEAQEKLDHTLQFQREQEQKQKLVNERQLNEEDRRIERSLETRRKKIQNHYKLMALVFPPIPPLLLALLVFVMRRVREREGASADRIR